MFARYFRINGFPICIPCRDNFQLSAKKRIATGLSSRYQGTFASVGIAAAAARTIEIDFGEDQCSRKLAIPRFHRHIDPNNLRSIKGFSWLASRKGGKLLLPPLDFSYRTGTFSWPNITRQHPLLSSRWLNNVVEEIETLKWNRVSNGQTWRLSSSNINGGSSRRSCFKLSPVAVTNQDYTVDGSLRSRSQNIFQALRFNQLCIEWKWNINFSFVI